MTEKPRARPQQRRPLPHKLPPIVRDVVILTLGTFGFLHEILSAQPEPMFVFASLAALGLPLALRADDAERA